MCVRNVTAFCGSPDNFVESLSSHLYKSWNSPQGARLRLLNQLTSPEIALSLGVFSFMNLHYIYLCLAWVPSLRKWRSEDNLFISFHRLSSQDPTQVLRLGGNFPYPEGCLSSPFYMTLKAEPSTLWMLRKQRALYH